MRLSTRTIRLYAAEGMPGVPGAYCVEDCRAWISARMDRRHRHSGHDDEDTEASSADSPQLERYRAARADLAELELAKKRGELIAADDVSSFLQQFAILMRGFGERLGKVSPELASELESVLSQGAALADQWIGHGDTNVDDEFGSGDIPE